MKEPKYNDIYRGIIIQNNDPENLGRVKVFVPHINMTLYEGWNEEVTEDKFFRYPGSNINSMLTATILERLKTSLPWATVVQPIFGPSGSGFYHSETDYATIERGEAIEEESEESPTPSPLIMPEAGGSPSSGLFPTSNDNTNSGVENKQNHSIETGFAHSKVKVEETEDPLKSNKKTYDGSAADGSSGTTSDTSAFSGNNSSIVNNLPPMSHPAGNKPSGIISIPEVGNHVWVIFEDGSALTPIITGAIFSREDHLANSGITE